jgi:hypothetical protein
MPEVLWSPPVILFNLIQYILSLVFMKYYIIQMPQSFNLKQSLTLKAMFRFKPGSKSVERYHTVVNYALNMENIIWNNSCEYSKQ